MKDIIIGKIEELIHYIRIQEPLIHCISNMVTVNDCANSLLAIGAKPIMAYVKEEMEEINHNSSALMLNMGALANFESMELALKCSTKDAKSIVIDPVGVAGSSYRRSLVYKLIEEGRVSAIRGNVSEILALIRDKNTAKGVDAAVHSIDTASLIEDIKDYAKSVKSIIIASGKTDIISDGYRTILIDNGSRLMSAVSGTGCMSSVLLTAFMSIEESSLSAAALCAYMGMAGEKAERRTLEKKAGTATFKIELIDALYTLSMDEIRELIRVEEV